jgi:large subunit ribosomal protein L28
MVVVVVWRKKTPVSIKGQRSKRGIMFRPTVLLARASLAFRTTALSVRGTPIAVPAIQAQFAPLLMLHQQPQQYQHKQQQVRHRSNRSRRGLYDGKDVRSGNNVSFSMRATKRKFKPNIFIKRLYSETLDDMLRFHVSTKALRSIDKAGGLDNYLLSDKNSYKLTEGEGFKAKKKILNRIKNLKDIDRKKSLVAAAAAEVGSVGPEGVGALLGVAGEGTTVGPDEGVEALGADDDTVGPDGVRESSSTSSGSPSNNHRTAST